MILVGGMGDMVKVLHADREVSFGNRHSETSTPKGFEKIIAPYVSVLLFGEYPHDYDIYPYIQPERRGREGRHKENANA